MYIHNTVAYQRMLDVEDSDSHVIAMFLPKQDICIASVLDLVYYEANSFNFI